MDNRGASGMPSSPQRITSSSFLGSHENGAVGALADPAPLGAELSTGGQAWQVARQYERRGDGAETQSVEETGGSHAPLPSGETLSYPHCIHDI